MTVAVPERDSLFSLVVRARPDHIVPQTALLRSSHHFSKRADTLTERVDELPIENQLVLRSDLSEVFRIEGKRELPKLPTTR